MKSNHQNIITKDTLILLMCLIYPAIHTYIWRVIIAFTSILGLYFSNQAFDTIVWILVVEYIFITSGKLTVKVKTLVIYLLFVLVALLSFLFTAYDYFSISVLFKLLIETLPVFLLGSFIDLKRVSHKQLYIAAIVTLIVSMLYSIYFVNTKDMKLVDNMDYAYKVLPSVLIIVARLFTDQKKKLAIVLSVIGTILLLLQGTRGPLLCLAVFICLMIYKRHGMGKFLLRVGAAVLIVAVVLGSQTVKFKLLDLSKWLDSSGYSSRFITMMIEGELADSNGRDAIKDVLLEDIKEDPFAIRGIFADRQATRGLVDREYGAKHEDGTYAHNLWVEMIYDWGVLLGGVLLLLVFLIVLNFIRKSNKEDAYIGMLFVCTGFVHLFLSGSYLQSVNFFFLIGFAINCCHPNTKTMTTDVIA